MTQLIKRVDEETSIPFKVILPLMVAIISATVWIQSTLTRIEQTQRDYITRTEVIEWREKIVVWRNNLSDQNPTIKVPYLTVK